MIGWPNKKLLLGLSGGIGRVCVLKDPPRLAENCITQQLHGGAPGAQLHCGADNKGMAWTGTTAPTATDANQSSENLLHCGENLVEQSEAVRL